MGSEAEQGAGRSGRGISTTLDAQMAPLIPDFKALYVIREMWSIIRGQRPRPISQMGMEVLRVTRAAPPAAELE